MGAHREKFDILRPEEFSCRLPDFIEVIATCGLPRRHVWAIHGNDDDANRKVRWIDPFFPESGEVLRRLPLGSAPPITLAIPEPLVQAWEQATGHGSGLADHTLYEGHSGRLPV